MDTQNKTKTPQNEEEKDNALRPMKNCAVILEPLPTGSKFFRRSVLSLDSDSDEEEGSRSDSRSGGNEMRKRTYSDVEGTAKEVAMRSATKRGRGRPPTTGEYVGLAKAKEDYLRAKREEIELEAEEEMAFELKKTRARRHETGATATDLANDINSGIRIILGVAARSRNLKGTFTKALKEAATQIEEATAELHQRTSTEETAVLRAQNARMQAELADLREEIANLRAEISRPREVPPPLPQPKSANDDLLGAVLPAVGRMLDAKLAGLEDRLLPEKRLRPPLRADVNVATVAVPEQELQPATSRQKTKPSPRTKATVPNVLPQAEFPPLPPPPINMDEGWSTVAKRGVKKNRSAAPVTAAPPSATTTKKVANNSQNAAAKPAPTKKATAKPGASKPAAAKSGTRRRLRQPTSSAVVLTLQPGAAERGVSYKLVMTEAKAKIKLEGLGIVGGLKCRLAATGAYLLEVPEDAGEKADALAAALKEVLSETDVRIARPVKCADLRLTGLDDSVSQEEVAEAVAAAGGCAVGAVKVGAISRTPPGMGMGRALVSCPVAAAKKVAEGGRLKIGWVISSVALLEARPLRCFRCLQNGHVASGCTSEVDRSGFCFRCGQPGHKVRDCTGSPHCTLCAALGKSTNHRVGSASCLGAKAPQGRKKRATPRTQVAPAPSLASSSAAPAAVEAMEAESIVNKD